MGISKVTGVYLAVGKRAFDLVLALAISPLILPTIAVLCVLARRDGGKGFFCHKRVGQKGREFLVLKVRTMVPSAEDRLAAYLNANPEARAEWDRDAKLKNDPRVTRFGNYLRKSSLDELPQIFNVFAGDMSFVGPRPVPRGELDAHYGPKTVMYETMKPGITGLWQVSGRNDVSYACRILLDERYLRIRSFWVDLKIIAKTALVIARRTGQ
jgi:exopolysaccharide production protein ExoY